ncbi:hypothetical protein [Hymenobacter koreensis]|uniref:DUF2157 domain-containing protein n=1 Tax=Hymenobacter koreensis TaxID=1084523 RepID=A0ABP8IXQ4_9BACT
MEDYAAKMARKTEAELRLYVTNRGEYREEAVLAALAELEQRGQQVPDGAAIRGELQASLVESNAEAVRNPAPEPSWMRKSETPTEETEEPDAPTLYSPATVAVFSLFSFLVGSVLMLINLLRLRRYGGAMLLLALIVLGISSFGWVAGQFGIEPIYALFGTNLVLALLYVYVLWPRFIGSQPYKSRSWLAPLIVMFVVNMLVRIVLHYTGISLPGLSQ